MNPEVFGSDLTAATNSLGGLNRVGRYLEIWRVEPEKDRVWEGEGI